MAFSESKTDILLTTNRFLNNHLFITGNNFLLQTVFLPLHLVSNPLSYGCKKTDR